MKGTPGVDQRSGIPGKSCTAGCALGCLGITPTINQAIRIFEQGGGTLLVCPVYGNSKYGSVPRGSYTLTFVPPKPLASTVAAAASSAAAKVEADVKASVGGLPVWMWLAAAGGLYFATK